MKKETILIAHNYTENSFASMSYYLAHYWAENGHDVVFISHKPYFIEPKIERTNSSYIYIYSWSSNSRPTKLNDIWHFAKIYIKHKPTKLIGHFVGANISIFVSKILSLGKVVTFDYYHTLSSQQYLDGNVSKFKKFRKYFFYKFFVDIVLCTSQLALKDFQEIYKLSNGVHHLTPLPDRYKKDNHKKVAVFLEKKDKLKLGFIGRIDKSKGIIELLNAFKLLDEDKFELNIVGNGQLSQIFTQQEWILPNLNYYGEISYDEIDNFIRKCDLIIIPSLSDNLVTVGIESLMNNVCLMLSKETGLVDYLEDNECVKINPESKQIYDKLNELFNNQLIIHETANCGRKKYEKVFSLTNYYKTMDKIALNINDE